MDTNKKKTKTGLNKNQLKILEILEKFTSENGYPPSIRDIGNLANITSTSMVNYYLVQLQRMGYIERDEHVSRSIRLLKPLSEIMGSASSQIKQTAQEVRQFAEELLRIPIVGRIVASKPVPVPASDFSYYDAESVIDVARSMLPGREKEDELFALEVQGDSMIDAMVHDGDYVIMKKAQEARNGEMVAVWLNNDETTLKYFHHEGNRIRLQPANPTMSPIYIDDPNMVEIKGKVIMVIRQVDTVK